MLGPLLGNPYRVSKALRGDLTGLYSARVGGYRVDYEIDEDARVVRVVYLAHRADVYRPR
jgi:mRNA interferase RelE/StbE